ncbi:MAG: NnrS family protein, partial [Gammaproteobacteria bacterium]|nr:NnrS family protein [Gammaproteobacteria bacterium]NIT64983.1 NnrS family protein [Gammaproteobacteria bacterium]NIV22002.1 NnrS family protein [Gammaproteobacteria bacterium]NIY33562.1 NnrS family protein [Gammaproteobacteria bacterium]
LRGGQRHNLIFLPLLALMAFGNLLVHLEALGLAAGVGRQGLWLGLALVILLMVIVGGRVIPFFTERGLPGVRTHKWVPVEVTAIAGTLAWAMGVAMAPASPLTGAFAAVAAVAHALRLAGWHRPATWRVPLLWVLHLGYGWIVLGLAFQALAATGLMSPALALHALTAGAIGTLTLGMMARVALGHTGRALEPPLAVAGAFVLVNAAAAVRVLVPALMAVDYRYPVAISGMLWSAAFAIFVWVYVPIVVRPRVDGRPG